MVEDLRAGRSKTVKLPVLRTVGDAYRSYFENFGTALRASWLWLIVLGVAAFFVARAQNELMPDILQGPFDQAKMSLPPQWWLKLQIVGLPQFLLLVVGGSSMAVAWHCFLPLLENPGVSGSNVADRPVWRYIFAGIAILASGVLVSLPILVPNFFMLLSVVTSNPPAPHAQRIALTLLLPILLQLVAIVLFSTVLLRLSPLLPARAVGNDSLTFREAWRLTRGNTWRLFWGMFLTIVPATALMQFVFIQSGLLPFPLSPGQSAPDRMRTFMEHVPLASVISTIYFSCVGLIAIGFLSFAYRHLIEPPRQPSDAK